MHPGKILVAEQAGAYVLKLVGDVRLTLCTTIDEFLERMFSAPGFMSVVIDLTEAEGIDSTSLGLLAKLAVQARQRHHFVPVIISTNPDITRLLSSMGFAKVFDIREKAPTTDQMLGELPVSACSEAEVRDKVIEAHRVLMGLNEKNRAEFSELVSTLEGCR